MTENKSTSRMTMLSERRTRLLGHPVNNGKGPPTLGFSIGSAKNQNSVSLIIYSNIEGDRGDGRLSAFGDITTTFTITRLVRAAVAAKGHYKRTIQYKNYIYFGKDKKSDEPMVIFDLDIIRDPDENEVRLVVRSWKRDDLVFTFRPLVNHPFFGVNGQLLSVAETSDFYALGWCDMVEQLVANAVSTKDISLFGETNQDTVDNRSPSLNIGTYGNGVSCTVWTNVESDMHIDRGRISASTDPQSFFAFARVFEAAARAQVDWIRGIHNNAAEKTEDYRKADIVRVSSTVIGRNALGEVYLSVVSANKSRPSIQYPLRLRRGWTVLDDTGNPLTPAQSSTIVCLAYRRLLPIVIGNLLSDNYVAPDRSKFYSNEGGSGGGNNNRDTGARQNQYRSNPPASEPSVPPRDAGPANEFDDFIPLDF